MSQVELSDLWMGRVGQVVDMTNHNTTFEWNGYTFVHIDDELIQVTNTTGQVMMVGADVTDLDAFDVNVDNLLLIKEDGYRGVICYYGYTIQDGHLYELDIVNDGVVYELLAD
jgi:hypothetical protein